MKRQVNQSQEIAMRLPTEQNQLHWSINRRNANNLQLLLISIRANSRMWKLPPLSPKSSKKMCKSRKNPTLRPKRWKPAWRKLLPSASTKCGFPRPTIKSSREFKKRKASHPQPCQLKIWTVNLRISLWASWRNWLWMKWMRRTMLRCRSRCSSTVKTSWRLQSKHPRRLSHPRPVQRLS